MDAISVVIPVRNGVRYIAEAIESVVMQGACVAEIIVVDDGSTDGTAALVSSLPDPRIRVVTPRGGRAGGVSAARNIGFAETACDWVHFLDADDRLRPGALSALRAEARPDDVAVYGDYDRIDAEGRPIGRRGLLRKRRKPSGAITRQLMAGNFIVTGAILVRRRAFAAIGGFETRLRYGEDWHAWCRLSVTGGMRFVTGLQVMDYRTHAASAVGGTVLALEDLLPAIDAVYTDPALTAGMIPTEVAAMRRSVEAHKGAYCIGQALRTRRYAKGLSALLRASLRDPRHAPRLWLVSGAALAGL